MSQKTVFWFPLLLESRSIVYIGSNLLWRENQLYKSQDKKWQMKCSAPTTPYQKAWTINCYTWSFLKPYKPFIDIGVNDTLHDYMTASVAGVDTNNVVTRTHCNTLSLVTISGSDQVSGMWHISETPVCPEPPSHYTILTLRLWQLARKHNCSHLHSYLTVCGIL